MGVFNEKRRVPVGVHGQTLSLTTPHCGQFRYHQLLGSTNEKGPRRWRGGPEVRR